MSTRIGYRLEVRERIPAKLLLNGLVIPTKHLFTEKGYLPSFYPLGKDTHLAGSPWGKDTSLAVSPWGKDTCLEGSLYGERILVKQLVHWGRIPANS